MLYQGLMDYLLALVYPGRTNVIEKSAVQVYRRPHGLQSDESFLGFSFSFTYFKSTSLSDILCYHVLTDFQISYQYSSWCYKINISIFLCIIFSRNVSLLAYLNFFVTYTNIFQFAITVIDVEAYRVHWSCLLKFMYRKKKRFLKSRTGFDLLSSIGRLINNASMGMGALYVPCPLITHNKVINHENFWLEINSSGAWFLSHFSITYFIKVFNSRPRAVHPVRDYKTHQRFLSLFLQFISIKIHSTVRHRIFCFCMSVMVFQFLTKIPPCNGHHYTKFFFSFSSTSSSDVLPILFMYSDTVC